MAIIEQTRARLAFGVTLMLCNHVAGSWQALPPQARCEVLGGRLHFTRGLLCQFQREQLRAVTFLIYGICLTGHYRALLAVQRNGVSAMRTVQARR